MNVLNFIPSRRGHFCMESGYHTDLWLDLDTLFSKPRKIQPFVDALASSLRSYRVDAICGPMTGGAFLAQWIASALDVEFWFTERLAPADRPGLFGVRYPLPHAFRDRVRGKRVAIVDDVMSAGSALRGTFDELQTTGALPVVAGALLVLGSIGSEFFAQRAIPVEAVARENFETWLPRECRLCAAGLPLQAT